MKQNDSAKLLQKWILINIAVVFIFALPIYLLGSVIYDWCIISTMPGGYLLMRPSWHFNVPPFPRGELSALATGSSMGLVMGSILGYTQWRMLKSHLNIPWHWIWINMISWSISLGLPWSLSVWVERSDLTINRTFIVISVFIMSELAVNGIGQYRLLKRRYPNAFWWIPTQLVGWSIGIFIATYSTSLAPPFLGHLIPSYPVMIIFTGLTLTQIIMREK